MPGVTNTGLLVKKSLLSCTSSVPLHKNEENEKNNNTNDKYNIMRG